MDDMCSLIAKYLQEYQDLLIFCTQWQYYMYIHVQQDKTSTFKKIFYSINSSIFLQNDKYSNTNYIWQQTTEYLIDILHFKSAVLHGPIPPRYAAVFF